jgi:hypothetical protein
VGAVQQIEEVCDDEKPGGCVFLISLVCIMRVFYAMPYPRLVNALAQTKKNINKKRILSLAKAAGAAGEDVGLGYWGRCEATKDRGRSVLEGGWQV